MWLLVGLSKTFLSPVIFVRKISSNKKDLFILAYTVLFCGGEGKEGRERGGLIGMTGINGH